MLRLNSCPHRFFPSLQGNYLNCRSRVISILVHLQSTQSPILRNFQPLKHIQTGQDPTALISQPHFCVPLAPLARNYQRSAHLSIPNRFCLRFGPGSFETGSYNGRRRGIWPRCVAVSQLSSLPTLINEHACPLPLPTTQRVPCRIIVTYSPHHLVPAYSRTRNLSLHKWHL
jgi:hypothetical protein